MDHRNSDRLKEVLKATSYQITKFETQSTETLDHLVELKPFMDWFTDFITNDSCMTQDELRMYVIYTNTCLISCKIVCLCISTQLCFIMHIL